ncbi:MAG: hypothetical protein ACK486_13210, partial [Cyanobacteriota bacterium]
MVIRTRLVELSTLEAFAYRQKLRGGQSGVVILRPDCAQPGLALLNHQSGEPESCGLPYSSRGPVRAPAVVDTSADSPDGAEEALEAEVKTVNSTDYQAVVKVYTNKKGELSYELL